MTTTSEIIYEEKPNKIVKTTTWVDEYEKIKIKDLIEVKERNIARLNEQLAVEQQELDDLLAIKNK